MQHNEGIALIKPIPSTWILFALKRPCLQADNIYICCALARSGLICGHADTLKLVSQFVLSTDLAC